MTQCGIEPASFQFVARHLNHCATAVPSEEGVVHSIALKKVYSTTCLDLLKNILHVTLELWIFRVFLPSVIVHAFAKILFSNDDAAKKHVKANRPTLVYRVHQPLRSIIK